MIQTNIHGLFRAVDKQIDLTVDQYRGNARAGELIVDVNPGPFQYAAYVGTAEGNLIQISTGNGTGGTVSSVSGNGSGLGFGLTGTVTTTGNITLTTPSVPTLRTNLGIGTVANVNLDGNVSNVLAGDGSWIPLGGGGGGTVPGGDDTEVQFNDGGAFGGSSSFTFDKSANVLTVYEAEIEEVAVGNSLYVGGVIQLNDVSNVRLNGGNPGETLLTDGSVDVSWGYTSKIANGSSYVDIPSSNGNVDIVTGSVGANVNMAVTTAFGTANVIKLYANGTLGEANISAAYVVGTSNLGVTLIRSTANISGNLNVVGTASNVIRRAYGFKASDQAVTLDGVEAKVLSTSVSPFKLNVYVSGATSASGWTENFMNNTSTIQTWVAVAVGGGSGYEMSEAMTDEGWGCKATFSVDATRTFQVTVVKAAPGPGGSIWSITIERLI